MLEPDQRNHLLYDPSLEHDACGIGAVVSLKGIKTYKTVDDALKIVEKLEHRAGKDAAGETGDGVGIMLQVPHKLMMKAAAADAVVNAYTTEEIEEAVSQFSGTEAAGALKLRLAKQEEKKPVLTKLQIFDKMKADFEPFARLVETLGLQLN